jgi:Mitochondrial ATP synthase epsilon chain
LYSFLRLSFGNDRIRNLYLIGTALVCLLACLLEQYVSRASTAVRGALKEPAKHKAAAQETFFYKAAAWKGGIQGEKTAIVSLGAAGKL